MTLDEIEKRTPYIPVFTCRIEVTADELRLQKNELRALALFEAKLDQVRQLFAERVASFAEEAGLWE